MAQSQRVIKLRKHLNLTQKDIADSLNTVPSKISAVEKGSQTLNPEMITIIIEKYNVNAEWILGILGNDDEILFRTELMVQEPVIDHELQSKYLKILEENNELHRKLNEQQTTKIEQLLATQRG